MVGRKGVTWLLAISAFWLSACSREGGSDKGVPAATKSGSDVGLQKVTLHVPGMIDRQGIT
jgi:hypothetical protein